MSSAPETTELITVAIRDWLEAEVVTSGESRNRYLDASDKDAETAQKKHDDIMKRLALPFDDDNNWVANKHKGHVQQRVPHWIDFFEATADDPTKADFYAAQAGFAPLVSASGSYRVQCYLISKGPSEYAELRSKVAGVDLEKAVGETLKARNAVKSFSAAEISFDGLRKVFDYTYAQTEIYFRGMIARLEHGLDQSGEDSLSVKAMEKSQISFIKLATDCVIMAAKLRKGNLAAVPFLEPVSISDQSGNTYYPLAERVDWLKVLSSS